MTNMIQNAKDQVLALTGKAYEKAAAAKEARERRTMFDPARTEAIVQRYGYSRAVCGLLEKSRGNLENLLDFLADEGFPPAEKEALLLTLTEKDWRGRGCRRPPGGVGGTPGVGLPPGYGLPPDSL